MFSQTLTTRGRAAPQGCVETVFQHSHPSSPFTPLVHLTQLQLPDTGDRERLANGCGVESAEGGTALEPGPNRGQVSGGGRRLFLWTGPPEIEGQGKLSEGLEGMNPTC